MQAEEAYGIALQKIWRIEGAETKANTIEKKLAGLELEVLKETTELKRANEQLQMRL